MKLKHLFILICAPCLLAAAPTTPKAVSLHPKTEVVVTHPQTSSVVLSRPTSKVVVFRPQSAEVVVTHPNTAEAEAAVTGTSTTSAGGAKGENSIPSGKSSTSMSGFQGKQAVDLKAAQAGKTSFDLGGGKPDSAKDSLAKSSDAFKGIGGNLDKAMANGKGKASKDKISQKVKGATKGKK